MKIGKRALLGVSGTGLYYRSQTGPRRTGGPPASRAVAFIFVAAFVLVVLIAVLLK